VTSITITHANMPIVFYRDNYLRAASYHDFLSLGPLQTNLMGLYGYFLWLAIWNTTLNEHLADGAVRIFIDDAVGRRRGSWRLRRSVLLRASAVELIAPGRALLPSIFLVSGNLHKISIL